MIIKDKSKASRLSTLGSGSLASDQVSPEFLDKEVKHRATVEEQLKVKIGKLGFLLFEILLEVIFGSLRRNDSSGCSDSSGNCTPDLSDE